MELSVILKSIDVLGPRDKHVQQLIKESSNIIYDSFDEKLAKHFIHLHKISVLKLKSNVIVDFDFVCNVLKPNLIKHENDIALNNLFVKLCNEGYDDVVNFFLSCVTHLDIHFDDNSPLAAAVENGHLNVVKSLITHGANPKDDYILNLACQEGHLHIIKFLYEYIWVTFPLTSIVHATNSGHLPVVQYLHKQYNMKISELAVKRAIHVKNMEILHYFLKYCPFKTYMLIAALETKDSEMIDFFITQRIHSYNWDQIFLYSITVGNKMVFDKLLKKVKIESIDTAYIRCCKRNNLKFAKELILKTSFNLCKLYYHSIIQNSVDITKYLIVCGGIEEIEQDFIKWVIEHDMIEMFKLFVQHCVKVNSKYILLAYTNEMIKFFLTHLNVKEKYKCILLKRMVKEENVEIIKILTSQKTLVSYKTILSAINTGNMECIKFLSCGYIVPTELIIDIIESGVAFEIFIFLYRLYNISLPKYEGIPPKFVESAILHGNTRVVQFFLSAEYFDKKQMLKYALKYKQMDVVKIIVE
jgi:hypothetical protein